MSKRNFAGIYKIGKKSKPKIKILIAGDSIGAGVGVSSFETSAAGRIANHFIKNNYVILKNIGLRW